MKSESQRIAIAEACGWTRQSDDSIWFDDPTNSFQAHEQDVPDYLNDLNAMHEAEKAVLLTGELVAAYESKLTAHHRHLYELGWVSMAFHATAAERAEAFLKTIGKWEES